MNEQLDKYFLGELSDREKADLFSQIESDPDKKAEFIRMQNMVAISELGTQKGDTEWAARKMKELEGCVARKRIRRLYISLAKYAAVIAILVVNIWLLADRFTPEEKPLLYTKIEVPKGQRVYMTFQDGTEAWLSPRSVIRIPNEFSEKERFVELDGEGFFSVTKDAKRPFIVRTGNYDIKVLGTKFNVFAYSKSKRFETNLVEGSVQVIDHARPQENLILKPNEMASLFNGSLVKSSVSFNNEDYLESGIFFFSNKKFSEILDYLTLWYNVKFEVKDTAKVDRYVSGKFRQSDDIERILKALQGVHHFRYKIINNEEIEIF